MPPLYRYAFEPETSVEDIEAALILSAFAAESLHGAAADLDVGYAFDRDALRLVVDAGTPAGNDFSRILTGFLRRELADAFVVERVPEPTAA